MSSSGRTERVDRVERGTRTRRIPRDSEDLSSDLRYSRSDPLDLVQIPTDINIGLSSARNSTMIEILGLPRDTFDEKCRVPTNDPVRSLIDWRADVGPFSVTGLKPAVASLRRIFVKVNNNYPGLYDMLDHAGMCCCRYIKGSHKISNHSWCTAIDISIASLLDPIHTGTTGRKDNRTLAGLAMLAPMFNEEGWYWGAGFSSFEDGMHFEIADQTIRRWYADGALDPYVKPGMLGEPNLSIGDSGKDVREIQEALSGRGFDILPDGIFGPITRAMVMDFQARHGLKPVDGIVGPKTREALGLA